MSLLKAIGPVLAFGLFIYIAIIFIHIAEFLEIWRTQGFAKALKSKYSEIPYGQKDTDKNDY